MKTYALLLDLMGFECSRLKAALVRLQRKSNVSESGRSSFLKASIGALVASKVERWENACRGALKVFRLDYDRQDALRNVEWAQEYWLDRREAVPTTQVAKCRVCEYKDTCHSSLAR